MKLDNWHIKEIKKLSKKYDVGLSVCQKMIEHCYDNISSTLNNENFQELMIHNFGSFYVSKKVIKSNINKIEKHLSKEKSEEKKEYLLEVREKLQSILKDYDKL